MHYLEITLLLQIVVACLLLLIVAQAARVLSWRGRLVLLVLALLCVAANPGRGGHIRAILRAIPQTNEQGLREVAEYHNLLLVSAVSVRGRLVSVGWLGRLFVGSSPCAELLSPRQRHESGRASYLSHGT